MVRVAAEKQFFQLDLKICIHLKSLFLLFPMLLLQKMPLMKKARDFLNPSFIFPKRIAC